MRLCLSLFLVAMVTACGQSNSPAQLNVGAAAPGFTSITQSGKPVSYPNGQPTVLRFWAEWCKFCESEMRAIAPVVEVHQGKALVWAVNVGQDRAAVVAYMNKLGVNYPAVLDESVTIAKQYGVVGLPTSYFVDAQGVIQAKIVGEADAKIFEQQLQTILPKVP